MLRLMGDAAGHLLRVGAVVERQRHVARAIRQPGTQSGLDIRLVGINRRDFRRANSSPPHPIRDFRQHSIPGRSRFHLSLLEWFEFVEQEVAGAGQGILPLPFQNQLRGGVCRNTSRGYNDGGRLGKRT